MGAAIGYDADQASQHHFSPSGFVYLNLVVRSTYYGIIFVALSTSTIAMLYKILASRTRIAEKRNE